MVDQRTLDKVALTRGEYELIVDRLGREPSPVELGLFGALWSEHCGYKNSKSLLRLFPTTGPRVLQGPGENAGIIDIGDGLAVAMKVESHNHPSAIEPFQGAATGIGGIVRDIFTMGARPIALLDALRFGPLEKPRNRYLFDGVVAGISAYGNCIGVPTVGGEVEFAEEYGDNPLVNVMAVGLVETRKVVRAMASGPGDVLMLVGADTGRDGIHGATFASVQLDDASEERRPAVQVGNPFLEKLLIEACLEVAETEHIVGMQDLGAAGLTSSVVETAAKGGFGAEVDVSKVSRRERGMTAYEVMLSESQERMLVVVRPGHTEAVRDIFARWDLHSDVIGQITADGVIRVMEDGKTVAAAPTALLTDPPLYKRVGTKPETLDRLQNRDLSAIPAPADLNEALLRMMDSPNLASKEYAFRQYDFMIQDNTVVPPGAGDAAVLRIKGSGKGIALTADCNGRHCFLDPYGGGVAAVAEAARNLVCVGAEPLAITNCLNFGNPEKPEIFFQLEQCVRGVADACRGLGTPVTGGNVSLYNETNGRPGYPTPLVGMLGLIEDLSLRCQAGFQRAGDRIVLIGPDGDGNLGGSEYLATVHGVVAGQPPSVDLTVEAAVQACCLAIIRARLSRTAHDCSAGGLGVALAESCVLGRKGARVELGRNGRRADARLFGESHSRIVVSVAAGDLERVKSIAERHRVPLRDLGVVGGDRLCIAGLIDLPVDALSARWHSAIENRLSGKQS